MEYKTLTKKSSKYPQKVLKRLGDGSPEKMYYHGALNILNKFTMCVVCSDEGSGIELVESGKVTNVILDYVINYIGGWHSVIESEIFWQGGLNKAFNNKNKSNKLTLFSSKGLDVETYESFLLDRFFPPMHQFPGREDYFKLAEAGELLMLSVSDPMEKRFKRKNIMERNFVACALADVVYIPYAEKGTKTYTIAKRVLNAGIPIFTIDLESCKDLLDLGIPGYNNKTIRVFLEKTGAELYVHDESPQIIMHNYKIPPQSSPPAKKPSQSQIKF